MTGNPKQLKDFPPVTNVAANSLITVTVFTANGQANVVTITVNNFVNSIRSLL